VIKVVFRKDGEFKTAELGEFPPDQVDHIVSLANKYGVELYGVAMSVSYACFDAANRVFEIVLSNEGE
jgi:hypothetical protein